MMQSKSLTCPECGSIIPGNAEKCECGHQLAVKSNALYSPGMGIIKFLAKGFHAYGLAWKAFLIHSVIYTIATQIFSPGFAALPNILSLEDATAPTTLGGIFSFILLTFTTLAFTLNADRSTEGEKIGFIESYGLALRLYGRYFFAVFLFFVGLAICSVPYNLWLEHWFKSLFSSYRYDEGAIFIAYLSKYIVLLIFSIPMIYWSNRYVFTPYALIIEDHDVKGAFTRSAYLSKNNVFSVAFNESAVGFCFFLVTVIPLGLIGWFIIYILPKLGISYFAAYGAAYTFAETIWVGLFIVFNVLYLKSLALEETLTKAKDESPQEEKDSSLKFHPAVILFPVIDIICKLYIPLLKAIVEKLKPRFKSFFEKDVGTEKAPGKEPPEYFEDSKERRMKNGKKEKVPGKKTVETATYVDYPESEPIDTIKISFIHRLKSFFKFSRKEDKFPGYFEDEDLKDRRLKKVKKVKKKKVPDKKIQKTIQYFDDDG